ncbi:MAG: GTP 3',8-cyclase MoaA [Bacteroidota bacterium]
MKHEANTPLTDQFGRVHNYLRISLTERCNLRCTYCMPAEGIVLRPKAHFMKTEEVLSIAETFVRLGVSKIRLTGGEPLVRNDAKAVMQGLSKLPVELAISSNGVLVDQFIETFKTCGIQSINISLDSLQENTFNNITRRNDFQKIKSNIDLLIQEKFHVKLNAVIIKGVNDQEIIDFINFTKHQNIHYRFIEFMPFNGNRWDWSKGLGYAEMLQTIETAFPGQVIKLQDKKNDTSKAFQIKGYQGTFAIISTVTNPFCDTCNRLRLTADGKIKNCLFSSSETDLLTALREGKSIEQIIRESVWHKKSVRGGMTHFDDFSNTELNQQNRNMISIGG